MTPRRRSALLWGLVGGLTFLVLAQGYLLLDGDLPVELAGLVAISAGVTLLVAALSDRLEPRLVAKGRT